MAYNTDNRDGQGGEELPDDLKRLVDAAEEDAADAGEQDIEQPQPGLGAGRARSERSTKARRHRQDAPCQPPTAHRRGRQRRRRHHVRTAYLGKEMQRSFLEYSMSVIVGRALPDVRDGLKPVHRRILVCHERKRPTRPKRVPHMQVGPYRGRRHRQVPPARRLRGVRRHGAPRAAVARMRVPLDRRPRQLRSIDGDSASRTCVTPRLASDKAGHGVARATSTKETVDFQPNYDEQLAGARRPARALPEPAGQRLQGIAVGMATNIPPHNLRRDHRRHVHRCSTTPTVTADELMKALSRPRLPHRRHHHGPQGHPTTPTETGRGIHHHARRRATSRRARTAAAAIVVTEMPYQVNRQQPGLKRSPSSCATRSYPRASQTSTTRPPTATGHRHHHRPQAATPSPQVVLNKLYKHTQPAGGLRRHHAGARRRRAPRAVPRRRSLHYYIVHQERRHRAPHALRAAPRPRSARISSKAMWLPSTTSTRSSASSAPRKPTSEAAARLTERFGLTDKQTDGHPGDAACAA